MTSSFTLQIVRTLIQAAIAAAIFAGAVSTPAQKRDHLTDPETDLVRFHQELDKRTEVFIKAIDRRFAIINGTPQPAVRKLIKDEPDWGEPPKGNHAELLDDIAGILDEAISNIDGVNQRDPKNPLIPRALRKLNAAANGYIKQLTAMKTKTTDADELAAMDRVAQNAQEVVEAGNKLPAAAESEDSRKKKP